MWFTTWPGANFIELLKHENSLLILHMILAKIYTLLVTDIAVVYLALQLNGVLAGNLILLSKVFFLA